jgi:hypothetical protein
MKVIPRAEGMQYVVAIDPLLSRDLEINSEYNRCYTIAESTNGHF